jgi:hypothetical protein
MGIHFGSVYSNVQANALPNSATETVVYQTAPLILAVDSARVFLRWFLSYIPGTGNTALAIRLRRGNAVTSPLVNVAAWQPTVAATVQVLFSGAYFDSPGMVETQYCLTLAQTGATVQGQLNDGFLLAFVL